MATGVSTGTLAVGLLLFAAVAGAFVHVGRRVRHRADRKERAPLRAFAWFWLLLAAAVLADGALTGLALAYGGSPPAWALHAVLQARIVTTLAALYALMKYLLFIYLGQGRGRWLAPAYLLLWALIEWTAWRLDPAGVDVQAWRGWYAWENSTQTPEYYLSITLLWLPVFFVALLYARLSRYAADDAARFRVRLLGTVVSGYFLATFIGFLDFRAPWWGLLQHVVGLTMASLALLAIDPPGWARRRFGAESL